MYVYAMETFTNIYVEEDQICLGVPEYYQYELIMNRQSEKKVWLHDSMCNMLDYHIWPYMESFTKDII